MVYVCKRSLWEFPVAQWVKDLSLSLQWLGLPLWCGFDPWPRNFHILKKKQKKKKPLWLLYRGQADGGERKEAGRLVRRLDSWAGKGEEEGTNPVAHTCRASPLPSILAFLQQHYT